MKTINRRSLLSKGSSILFLINMFGRIPNIFSNNPESDLCGLDPEIDRTLSDWKWNVLNDTLPGIEVWASYKKDSEHILVIHVSTGRYIKSEDNSLTPDNKMFMVKNNGNTWQPLLKYDPMINKGSMNILNRVYQHVFNCSANASWFNRSGSIELMRTGELIGELITPHVKGSREIEDICLISAGSRNEARIYAKLLFAGDNKFDGIYRSDDYGRNFSKITDKMIFLTESRADPKILIGVTQADQNAHRKIAVSKDEGITWNPVEYDIVDERVFQDLQKDVLRTKRKSEYSTC